MFPEKRKETQTDDAKMQNINKMTQKQLQREKTTKTLQNVTKQ